MTYTAHLSKEGIHCTGPNGPITVEEFQRVLMGMAQQRETCQCKIEMATFRDPGSTCLHCQKIIMPAR